MFFLKTFREPAFLTVRGRVFHSLGAEQENDPSYIVVRDFGTYNDPLSVDRKFKVCTCDTGFSKVDMYSGVRSFKALYVNTALLKFILFGTENQPSSLNIVSDGVLNSACKIMRAARFCNFDRRSICVPAADPHVREP